MATLQKGDAIFSNNLGRFSPRELSALPRRIILRSSPEDDMESMIAELRANFPDQCKAITSPVANLYDYFDHYDQQFHGGIFLGTVLAEICHRNLMRKQAILNFTQEWIHLNHTNLPYILGRSLDTAFTPEDVEKHGKEFLQDVLEDLQQQQIENDHVDSAPFPSLLQHWNQVDPTLQRNFSDPTALHLSVIPPKMPPSAPSSSPMTNQGFLTRPPFPPMLQQSSPAKNDPSKQHHFSQHYLPRLPENDGRSSNISLSGCGSPDMVFPLPPPPMMSGQFPHHHMSSGPTRFNQPANRMQCFPKTKGPVYIGPSNDARNLERQGVPINRPSFGERNMNQGNPHSFGFQSPHSRQPPPSRQGRYSGLLQGAASPIITHSSLSNEILPGKGAHNIPENVHGQFLHTRQESMPEPRIEELGGFGKDHTSSNQPLAFPHGNGVRNHETSTPTGHILESTTPGMTQGMFITGEMDSRALRRNSNSLHPAYGANPAAPYIGQHPNKGFSRGRQCPIEEYRVSDRKIWVGGLRPDTDVTTLTRLLQPFGPCELHKILVSKSGSSDFGGFTFAEYGYAFHMHCIKLILLRFQTPQTAFSVVKALNSKHIDSLGCRVFLKPARINTKFNDQSNSGQNGFRNYTGRDKFNEVGDGNRRRLDDSVSRMPLNQTMQSPYKENPQSADRSELGMYRHPASAAEPAFQSPPKVSSSENPVVDGTHSYWFEDSNVRDTGFSTAVKSAPNPVDSAAIDSPSPSKKKKGRVNKDGLSSDKECRAKIGQDIVLQLRTGKPKGATLDEVMDVTNPPKDKSNDAAESSIPMSIGQASSDHQEHLTSFSGISASDLKDELEQYAQPQNHEPTQGLSRVHTASTMERRLSSASLMISTDPTSCAQSERSGSGTDGVQTPVTPKDQATSTQTLPMSTDSPHPGEHIPAGVTQTDNTPPFDIVAKSNGVATPRSESHPDLLLTTTGSQLKDEAASVSPATEPLATAKTWQDLTPMDFAPKVNTATDLKSEEHQKLQRADSKHVEDPVLFGEHMDIFEKLGRKEESSAAPLGGSSPKRATAGPMQDMSPNTKLNRTSGPILKRGLPRDPKTLVAVPKILPPIRSKAHTGSTDAQASITAHKSTTTYAKSDIVKGDEANFDLDTKKLSTSPNITAVSRPVMEGEIVAVPPLVKPGEQPPALSNGKNHQPSSEVLGNQTTSEAQTENCDVASTATPEDGVLDPAYNIPQPCRTAVVDEESHPPVSQSTEEQPVIQQKKRKTKKPKKSKKPKPLQASSVNGSSPTHSRSNTEEEIKVPTVVPKAETPYLADDNTPLPQPSFVRHNHSSMRSRHVPIYRSQAQTSQNGSESSIIKSPPSNATPASTTAAESGLLCIFSKLPNNNVVVWPGERSDPQSSQDRQGKEAQDEDPQRDKEDQRTFSAAEKQARLKVLDNHVQKNNINSIKTILQALAEVAPCDSGQAISEKQGASNPRSEGSSDTLSDLGEARLLDITSDDEAQQAFLPPATREEQEQPSISEPGRASPLVDVSQVAQRHEHIQNFLDVQQPFDTDSGDQPGEDTASSRSSTLNASPERSQDCSTDPVKGLGISITHPASIELENGSPSRREPPKTPSWKEIVVKSPASSLQTGDIVEFISKDTDGDNTGSQASGIIRKFTGKDPWRVPSAEQPWGKNNKSKGKPTADSTKL
ncbi:MAG: hypothetical protein Q9221_006087 [Calogaya cf. arnoldii]